MKSQFDIVPAAVCVFALALLLNGCGNAKRLSRTEAEDRLKILNSDLMHWVHAAQTDRGLHVLQMLFKGNAMPFPALRINNTAVADAGPATFLHDGIYHWHPIHRSFLRLDGGSGVTLHYPDSLFSGRSVRMEVSAYEEMVSEWIPGFPTTLWATLYVDGDKELVVEHTASVADAMPADIATAIRGEGYKIHLELHRRRAGNKGPLEMHVTMAAGTQMLLDLRIHSALRYHDPGYSAETVQIDAVVAGKRLTGHIAYGAIDPTSECYTRDFNRHSNLVLYDEAGCIIGDVVLAQEGSGNTQDFAVRFADGTTEMLKEYVLPLKELMDLKY